MSACILYVALGIVYSDCVRVVIAGVCLDIA